MSPIRPALFLTLALLGGVEVPGLTTTAVAQAATAELAGTWTLDKDASGSVDPLLKAQGVSFLERKVAAGLDVTQTITVEGDTVTLHIVTSKNTQDQTLTGDGAAREVGTQAGPATVSSVWSGEALVTTTVGVDKDGAPTTMVMTRALADGGQTLNQLIAFTTAAGETITLTRVFRRQ